MKVLVKYMYPVYVEIDLDDGAVRRVVVDDEASAAPDEVVGSYIGPWNASPAYRI